MLPLSLQEPRQVSVTGITLVGSGGRSPAPWLRGSVSGSGEESSDGLGETEAGPAGLGKLESDEGVATQQDPQGRGYKFSFLLLKGGFRISFALR